MKIHAIKCRKCLDTVFSRTHHDFRWCSCQSVAIDGGFSYMKITGNPEDIEEVTLELEVSKDSLRADWNLGLDKFGLIKNES